MLEVGNTKRYILYILLQLRGLSRVIQGIIRDELLFI